MDQPAEQAHREAEQNEQPGPEMPQEIFIRVGGRLDAQMTVVGALDDQVFLHDGEGQAGQPGEPVGAIDRGRPGLFADDAAIRRDVFHKLQIPLVDRNPQSRSHGKVILPDGRIRDGLRQRGKLCGGLHTQGGVGVLADDMQRLLPGQHEYRQHDEQGRPQHATLSAEAGRTQGVREAGKRRREVAEHTEGIGRLSAF